VLGWYSTVLAPALAKVRPLRSGHGVRQGDPEDVGYRMGARLTSALGYVDDIVLLASTKNGLQENLTRLDNAFKVNGLSINTKKTGVLSMVASGRDKKVKIDTTPNFTLGGARILQRSPVDVWTYLGCMY